MGVTSKTMFAVFDAKGIPAAADKLQAQPVATDYNLAVMEYDPSKSWSKKGENNHTVFKDNAADSLFNVSGRLAGINSNNVAGPLLETLRAGGVAAQLVDTANLDFRPKKGSQLQKAGAGAYAQGSYWIPGKQ